VRSQELNHPNIVRVFDLHTTRAGMPFIKMEYVKGNSLTYWLEDCPNGVMHWREVVEIAHQLCVALQYAHENAGVVHRDIKPGNLLLRTDRILKLTDFGIAEACYTTRAVSVKSKALGTLWYASPQQLLGQRATPADDIHAVGATLYELLAGEPPFLGETDHSKGDSAEALIHQVRYDAPEPIRQRLARREIQNEVPQKLATLIHRCLEKDAQARPLAREIIAALPSPTTRVAIPPLPLPEAESLYAEPPPPAYIPPSSPSIRLEVVPPVPAEAWVEPPAPPQRESLAWVWVLLLLGGLMAGGIYYYQNYQKLTDIITTRVRAEVTTTPPQPNDQDTNQVPVEPPSQKPLVVLPQPVINEGPKGTVKVDLRSVTSVRQNIKRKLVFTKTKTGEQTVASLEGGRVEFTQVLTEGEYKVLLTEQNDSGWEMSSAVNVTGGRTNSISFVTRQIGFVRIESDPPGATVRWKKSLTPNLQYQQAKTPATISLPMGVAPFWVNLPYYEEQDEVKTPISENGVIMFKLVPSARPRFDMPKWTNSLGMIFHQSPAGWVCETETRVGDFRQFVKARNYEATNGMISVTTTGFKQIGRSWEDPWPDISELKFRQTDYHPVVGVNWYDATNFCHWLTETERKTNALSASQSYQLLRSDQWFDLVESDIFPWGGQILKEKYLMGNYSGRELRGTPGWPESWPVLENYEDDNLRTALAAGGVFKPNRFGLYHMGGNAAEWTSDRLVVGRSWADGESMSQKEDFKWLGTKQYLKPPESERNDRTGFRIVIVDNSSAKVF
jgi:serine/threonine protein kinase